MAGEKKGKAYEALVMVALQELKRRGKLHGEIFWNQKPAEMTIEPDFSIGPDPSARLRTIGSHTKIPLKK